MASTVSVNPLSATASRRSQSQFEQITTGISRARSSARTSGTSSYGSSTRDSAPARSFSMIVSYSPGCTSEAASMASVRSRCHAT